ncbi:MAG: hypothetical protein H6765_08155 [Candidatus Peribacteria bacterium]|nr:MAG: hypothetical protein H6765_08155 [Candidatus Peribacteria bacterium]
MKKQDYSKHNADKVEEIFVLGDIAGKDVIIHDDMLDTAGTFIKLLEAIHQYKPRSVNAVFSHALCNGPAFERLEAAYQAKLFESIIVTDSVYHETLPPYMHCISTAGLFADKIASIAK